MKEETLEQAAERLLNLEGNAKGEVLRTFLRIVEEKEGKEGLEKLKKKLRELGVKQDLDNVKSFQWTKEGVNALAVVTGKELFGWTEEEVFEIGRSTPKISFVIKVLVKYLVSIETLFKNSDTYWKKHYDFGSFEPVEFNKEKQKVVLREKDYKTHPLVCIHHAGYFKGLAEFVLGENVTIEETECVHEGAEYNEYVIRW